MNDNKKSEIIKTLVWVLMCLYALFFGCITFLKYQSFAYRDFDLAVHAQSIWNILHGSIYSSILGIDFLGNHGHFILFLIAPIYFIFRHPLTLLFIQTFSLSLAAYPIYLIAKEELNEKIGLAIVFIYLLYPALGYVNLFEFHPTVLAACFLAFMFYHFKKQNFKRFVLFMILSLLCQENIPLLILPVGIYAFLAKRDSKWALTPIFLSSLWFLVVVGKVIPYFNKDTVQFIELYRHLGNSIPEVAKFIITHPVELKRIIFTQQKIIFMAQLFMPLSFFSLFDPRVLITSLVLFQHLLSLRQTEHVIYYHYAAEMIPFIFISAIYGIKRFLKIPYIKASLHHGFFISAIIIVAIASNVYLGPHIHLMSRLKSFKKDSWDHQKERFLSMVPANASVVATFEFLPRLSHRKGLYSFHHTSMGFHTLSNKPYCLPEGVEYALLDFNDFLTFNSFYFPGKSDANLRDFISKDWGVLDMVGSIVLLKRHYQSQYALFQVLDRLPKVSNVTHAVANNELELLGFDVGSEDETRTGKIKLTLYWKALKHLDRDYGNFIDLLKKDGRMKYRFVKPICYRIFPTYAWEEGKVIKEDYNILLPEDIKENDYSVRIGVFGYGTKDIYHISSAIPSVVDDYGRVKLRGPEIIQR